MYSKLRYIPYIFWKKRPIHLTLFVTKRCNSFCPFCFYRYTSEEDRTELSFEEIERISNSIGPLLWLAFSGGEIFLRDDIVEISKIFYKTNKPSIMLFSTNGLLPERIKEKTEGILKSCTKSIVVVKLSLDGIGSEHDSFRGVQGAFDKIMKTYLLLNETAQKYRNLELGINTVFYSENQNRMEDIIKFVRTLDGIKTHTISLIRGDIPGEFKKVDIKKYQYYTNMLKDSLRTYGFRGAKLKAAQDILQHNLIYEISIRKRPLLPCYAGRLSLVITETGDIYPCENFSKKMLLGNLREEGYNLKKIINSPRAHEIISFIKKGCYCTHECYLMMSILFNPLSYPALLKEYLKLLFFS